jgi:hypothetical protein
MYIKTNHSDAALAALLAFVKWTHADCNFNTAHFLISKEFINY